MVTLFHLTHRVATQLSTHKAIHSEVAWRQAKDLIQQTLHLSPLDWAVHLHNPVPLQYQEDVDTLLAIHITHHKPFSRIFGQRAFWKHAFRLNPWTLDPRPESEGLLLHAHRLCPQPLRRILDIGTGSGCLLLSLLADFPQAEGVGTDIEPQVFSAARENAHLLGLTPRVQWITTSWTEGVTGPFECILSNPPYISHAEMAVLPPEVALWDPPTALAGGDDGLDAYRTFIPCLPALLAPQGIVVLEIGAHQGPQVMTLLAAHFPFVSLQPDLQQRPRYAIAALCPLEERLVKNLPAS